MVDGIGHMAERLSALAIWMAMIELMLSGKKIFGFLGFLAAAVGIRILSQEIESLMAG